MANNQYVNKVIFGNDTLIDLSSDTIEASALISGLTAHDKSGAAIIGTMPTRNGLDFNLAFQNNGKFGISVPYGCYTQGILTVEGVQISIPASGITNSFYIEVPNGTTTPSTADDWLRLTISVDSNGNSEVTDDTIPATGVSF